MYGFKPEKYFTNGAKVIVNSNEKGGIEIKDKEGIIESFNEDTYRYQVDFGNGFQGYFDRYKLELVNPPKKKHNFDEIMESDNEDPMDKYDPYSGNLISPEKYKEYLEYKSKCYAKDAKELEEAIADPNTHIFYGYDCNIPMFARKGDIVGTKYGDTGLIVEIDEENIVIEDEYGEQKNMGIHRIVTVY